MFTMDCMFTNFAVENSKHFPFRAWPHKVTDRSHVSVGNNTLLIESHECCHHFWFLGFLPLPPALQAVIGYTGYSNANLDKSCSVCLPVCLSLFLCVGHMGEFFID